MSRRLLKNTIATIPKLRVSNAVFNAQLRAVLLPGQNITLNTNDPDFTTISASGGGGGGNTEIVPSTPNHQFDGQDPMVSYATDGTTINGILFNSLLTANLTTGQITYDQPSTSIVIESNTILETKTLDVELCPGDFTIVMAVQFLMPNGPNNAPLTQFLAFAGSDTTYPFSLELGGSAFPGSLLINIGPEVHFAPLLRAQNQSLNLPTIIIVRISQIASLKPQLCVFNDGQLMYTNRITVKDLRQSLAGNMTLATGPAGLTMKLFDFSIYSEALTESYCGEQATHLNTKYNFGLDLSPSFVASLSGPRILAHFIPSGTTLVPSQTLLSTITTIFAAANPVLAPSNVGGKLRFSTNTVRIANTTPVSWLGTNFSLILKMEIPQPLVVNSQCTFFDINSQISAAIGYNNTNITITINSGTGQNVLTLPNNTTQLFFILNNSSSGLFKILLAARHNSLSPWLFISTELNGPILPLLTNSNTLTIGHGLATTPFVFDILNFTIYNSAMNKNLISHVLQL